MKKTLLAFASLLLSACFVEAQAPTPNPRHALSANYQDVYDAVNGTGTFSGAGGPAADGTIVTIPAGPPATWADNQTIVTNNFIQIVGAGPSGPLILNPTTQLPANGVTWGTTINMQDTAFIFNLGGTNGVSSPYTARLSGINLHFMGAPNVVTSVTGNPTATGSTSFAYKVIAYLTDGSNRESNTSVAVVNGAAAALTNTTFVHITWTSILNTDHYVVYRISTGLGTPNSVGAIATVSTVVPPGVTGSLDDKGLTATGGVASGLIPPAPKQAFIFNGVARCWNDSGTPRGGVRIDHMEWTADDKDSSNGYKFALRGWITGVMDHCFINYQNDGSWGFSPESTAVGFSGSPTGDNKTPLQTPGGFNSGSLSGYGHWSWSSPLVAGHNIPNGDANGPTATYTPAPPITLPPTIVNFPDTSGDTFYYEDNIWKTGALTFDSVEGANRRVWRHNTNLGNSIQEHGNDSGSSPGMHFSEEYNNKYDMLDIAVLGTLNLPSGAGGTWKIGNRGGVKFCFNQIWTGYPQGIGSGKYLVSAASYRLYGGGNFGGPADGTNYWDQNWNENLFGPLIFPSGSLVGIPNFTYVPIVPIENEAVGPHNIPVGHGSFSGQGAPNVADDVRIGSVYAKSGSSPHCSATYKKGTPTNPDPNTYMDIDGLIGVDNQWAGFQIRNVRTSQFANDGGQDTDKGIATTGVAPAIAVTAGGTGYTSAPTVTIGPGGGINAAYATATAHSVLGPVTAITLTNGGTGYTSVPGVTITGSSGSGATATAVISGGQVTKINLTNGGSGYTSTPTVSIAGGNGSGATASATIKADAVAKVILDNPGTYYNSAPPVSFSGGGGSGAVASVSRMSGAGSVHNTWTFIQSSTANSSPTGHVTVAVNGDFASPARFTDLAGTNDPWEIRFVRRYGCMEGAGMNEYPFNGKQPAGSGAQNGPILLARNGTALTASATPGPSPVTSKICTSAEYNSGNCNPVYPNHEELGVWFWTHQVRPNHTSSFTALANNTFSHPNQRMQQQFWTGGWHENVNTPYPGYTEVSNGTLPDNSPYRRIGADWDGDPAPPMAGVSFGYTSPLTPSPAPSPGADLRSWRVYGSAYPHPLTGALSSPVFAKGGNDSINVQLGDSGHYDVQALGNPTPTVTKNSGPTPANASLVGASGSSGSGIATVTWTNAANLGDYVFAFTASSTQSPAATQTLTVHVVASTGTAPTISTGTAASFTVGTNSTFNIIASGSAPIAITENGTLPAGIQFADDGGGHARLFGSTTAAPGQFPITITASNGVAPNAVQSNFVITVNGPTSTAPSITSQNNATFTIGQNGPTFTVVSNGTPAATISKSGTLPNGLTFTPIVGGTATITGTPASGTQGSYPLTITASNGTPPNANQSFALTVINPVVSSPTPPSVISIFEPSPVVTPTPGPSPTPPPMKAPPVGVYLFSSGYVTPSFSAASQIGSAIDNANVDGARVLVKWSDIEQSPYPGTPYNWTQLDQAVAYCATTPLGNHKKIGIMVNAGRNTPDWMYQTPFSVAQYTIVDTLFFGGGHTPDITSSTYNTYLNRWQQFVQDLGDRYDSNPAVSFIIPTGIAFDDQWIMDGPTDSANLGDTSGKVDTWKADAKRVIDFYMASFPTTTISALQRPPFDASVAGSDPVVAMQNVTDYAIGAYGCRFGYGYAPLTASTTTSDPGANEMFTHYLTNPTHSETDTPAPNTAAGVDQLTNEFTAALNLKVRCIELYRAECEAGLLQPVITNGRTSMLAIPSPTPCP